AGTYLSTVADTSELEFPMGLWVGDDGVLYVTDRSARVVRRYAADGTPLGAWGAGSGLLAPQNIEGSADGRLYVSDGGGFVQVLDANGARLDTYGEGWIGNPTGSAVLG